MWVAGRGQRGYWTWHGWTTSNFSDIDPIWRDGHPALSTSNYCTAFMSYGQGISALQCNYFNFALCETR